MAKAKIAKRTGRVTNDCWTQAAKASVKDLAAAAGLEPAPPHAYCPGCQTSDGKKIVEALSIKLRR